MAIPILAGQAIGGMVETVGTGIGAIISARMTKAERKRLKELEARKEAGELGYSSEELGLMEQTAKDPIRAAGREAFLATRAGATGVDAGASARRGIAESTSMGRSLAAANAPIAAANADEKRRQQAELSGLYATRKQARADTMTAVGQMAGDLIKGGIDIGKVGREAKAQREVYTTLGGAGMSASDLALMRNFTAGRGMAPAVAGSPPPDLRRAPPDPDDESWDGTPDADGPIILDNGKIAYPPSYLSPISSRYRNMLVG